jgi:hypothetical protein
VADLSFNKKREILLFSETEMGLPKGGIEKERAYKTRQPAK